MYKISKVYNIKIGTCIFSILVTAIIHLVGCTTLSSSEGSIPDRNAKAMTGSQFLQHTNRMSESQREKAILKEIRRGNMPKFLRDLKPVVVEQTLYGKNFSGTIYVMPDYLSIGDDDDYIRVPMSPIVAQKIADHFGYILPTTLLVDAIYRQADTKLTPKPLKPGPKMRTNNYYFLHHNLVENQLKGSDRGLIAGHKKDIVITKKLRLRKYRRPRRVAIYGWHSSGEKVIQPLSLVHDEHYADYSHGVRLIYPIMRLNGSWIPVVEVLESPKIASLLSKEGRIPMPRVSTDHTWH